MRYLMLICSDDSGYEAESSEETEVMGADYAAFMAEVAPRGVIQGGERLRPVSTASTVQVREGEVLTADGPFAETKEQVGGYFLVDCADLDEAVEIASKIPTAKTGTIEIRPIWELEM